MTDIVGVFETHAESLGWTFNYGNKANQNLLTSERVVGRKYFLLETVTRTVQGSEFGGEGEIEFSGDFLLLVKSDR